MAADHSIANGDAGSVDSFSTVNSIDVSAYTVGGGQHGRTETEIFEPGPGQTGTIEIEIPSRVDLVAVVRMIVAAATSAVDAIHGDRLDDLRWITSEATTNAIEANMALDHGGRVVVTCEVADGLVRLAVSDEGQGMPEPPVVPDIADPERLLVEGAFGIPLMQHLSSALSFHTGHDGTTVEMELHQ
ncbi:MAG: ATP-binding protein [Acidimicrobiales bacterium]